MLVWHSCSVLQGIEFSNIYSLIILFDFLLNLPYLLWFKLLISYCLSLHHIQNLPRFQESYTFPSCRIKFIPHIIFLVHRYDLSIHLTLPESVLTCLWALDFLQKAKWWSSCLENKFNSYFYFLSLK